MALGLGTPSVEVELMTLMARGHLRRQFGQGAHVLSAVALVALVTTQAIAPGVTTTAWAVTGSALAGGAPQGFDPVSVSAVSPGTYWVLGAAPCPGHICGREATEATAEHCDEAPTPHATPLCTWLVRTDDGSASFVDLPAPPAPLLKGTYNGGSEGIDTISFANRRDGFGVRALHDGGGGRFVLGDPRRRADVV